ncbi:hypothetical protein VPNG_10031 [Cytospora leucostoma]|uniref:MYND-type domain-containing protein n=1 Tax=Cytospora leucostoma TaxID=1230097 RepID=A0A423VHN5_9PEZI|nr:hypothetical protein VPNG_10031 [Cytospora leucostoma]
MSTNKPKNPNPKSSKAATTNRTHSTDSSTEVSPAGGIKTRGTAKCLTESSDGGVTSPMFPTLPSAKATPILPSEMEQRAVTALQEPLAEVSRDVGIDGRLGRVTGRVRRRWIKSADPTVRLVVDTTPNDLNSMGSSSQETHPGDSSLLPGSRRRSARLASSTAGLEDTRMSFYKANNEATRSSATQSKAAMETMDNGLFVTAESKTTPQKTYSAMPSDSSLTDIDELPHNYNMAVSTSPASKTDRAELTSPIPELVADIARIIETSSPIAVGASTSNKWYASGSEPSTEGTAVTTYATSRIALLSAVHANHQTEPMEESDDDLCSTQTMTIDQSLSCSTSAEAFHAENNPQTPVRIATPSRKAVLDMFAANHPHKDSNTHDIKRRADEMSRDGHILTKNQQLTTPSRAPLDSVFPANDNLIELASSRDCYDNDYDGLDIPDGNTWLDGEMHAAFRIPRPRNQLNHPHGNFHPNTCISSETNDSAVGHPVYSPQLHPQAGPSRTSDEVASIEKHGATVYQHTASSPLEANSNLNCGDCGKVPEKYLVCARCLKTRYCGKYCQIWNWPVHRQVCVASAEADTCESERQEEYLQGMWAGAIRQLEEGVVDRHRGTDGGMGYEAALQSKVGGSFLDFGAGENIIQQGVRLLGGAGAVAGDDGAGQQGRGVVEDEGVAERRNGADQNSMNVDQDEENQEDEAEPDDHPITPESMFKSRARSLHLAQAFIQVETMDV